MFGLCYALYVDITQLPAGGLTQLRASAVYSAQYCTVLYCTPSVITPQPRHNTDICRYIVTQGEIKVKMPTTALSNNLDELDTLLQVRLIPKW